MIRSADSNLFNDDTPQDHQETARHFNPGIVCWLVGKLNSSHPDFVNAIRVDGKAIKISKDIASEDLARLLDGTPSGRGEPET